MGATTFTLMLEGLPYAVERRGDLILVNGIEFSCALKDGAVLVGGTPHTVTLSPTHAEVDGITYAIEAKGLEEPRSGGRRRVASAQAAEAAGAITAVMPGLIIKVLKAEGDRVEAGETVLILEAMKMQNDVQAKAPGVITQMNVKPGDNVEIRQVLCVVE